MYHISIFGISFFRKLFKDKLKYFIFGFTVPILLFMLTFYQALCTGNSTVKRICHRDILEWSWFSVPLGFSFSLFCSVIILMFLFPRPLRCSQSTPARPFSWSQPHQRYKKNGNMKTSETLNHQLERDAKIQARKFSRLALARSILVGGFTLPSSHPAGGAWAINKKQDF